MAEKAATGSPGGSVVKNLPANAKDTGLIPGPGRSHMPQSNEAHTQLLSLCSRAWEPQILRPPAIATEACVPKAHTLQQEKPLQWEARTLQLESIPILTQLERASTALNKVI